MNRHNLNAVMEREREAIEKVRSIALSVLENLKEEIALTVKLANIWQDMFDYKAGVWVWSSTPSDSCPLHIKLKEKMSIEKHFNLFLEEAVPLIKDFIGEADLNVSVDTTDVTYAWSGNKHYTIFVSYVGSACKRVIKSSRMEPVNDYKIVCN